MITPDTVYYWGNNMIEKTYTKIAVISDPQINLKENSLIHGKKDYEILQKCITKSHVDAFWSVGILLKMDCRKNGIVSLTALNIIALLNNFLLYQEIWIEYLLWVEVKYFLIHIKSLPEKTKVYIFPMKRINLFLLALAMNQ